MKYHIENFAEDQWWRFTRQPFLSKAEAEEHAARMLVDFPSPGARLRVREYPPAEELFDSIVEDIESHREDRLKAMISILRETTINRLLEFYETDAPPGGADRGHAGDERSGDGPAGV